jgi:hypothetical protein
MARFRRLSDRADDPRWSFFAPAAPTGVTATASNAQAVVSWTAPSIVVPPLTDYSVQYSTDGGTTWTAASDAVSTAASAAITGLTNGTAHVFRVAGINGIGTGAYSAASAAVTPTAGDALFSSVSLLLPFDGTGNTFVDSSATPKTITAFGNATQSAAESKWGGKSLYLDGNGDYLAIPSSSAFSFGAYNGPFTIEFWMWMQSYSNNFTTVMTRRVTGAATWQWQIGFPSNGRFLNVQTNASGTFTLKASSALSLSAWHYIAWSYDGTTYRLYINGDLVASSTAAGGFSDSGSDVLIGSVPGGAEYFNGYIDDLRITKGSARGMTGATIPVPTAAFPTS